MAPDGPWRAIGLAAHLGNGAAFALVFDRLGCAGVRQGVLAAEAENALLWPLIAVLDRLHPDVRSGVWPQLARNPHAAAQECSATPSSGRCWAGSSGVGSGVSYVRLAELLIERLHPLLPAGIACGSRLRPRSAR